MAGEPRLGTVLDSADHRGGTSRVVRAGPWSTLQRGWCSTSKPGVRQWRASWLARRFLGVARRGDAPSRAAALVVERAPNRWRHATAGEGVRRVR